MTKDVLKLAAQAVLDRWNSPAWTWHKLGPTGDLMADLQEALAQPEQPDHHPQHTYTLQEMLAQLHLYEEINEHYAKCNPGPEALRDWVAERVNTPPSPVQEPAFYTNERGSQPVAPWGKSNDYCVPLYYATAPQPVQPLQEPRSWAGLTGQEKAWIASVSLDVHDAVHRTDAKLKEKNT